MGFLFNEVFNMDKICEYACNRYYHVVYKDCRDREQFVQGLLLNYNSGNIVLLAPKGIYHIKYKDIMFMMPIEPPMNKLSEEFKELLKHLWE